MDPLLKYHQFYTSSWGTVKQTTAHNANPLKLQRYCIDPVLIKPNCQDYKDLCMLMLRQTPELEQVLSLRRVYTVSSAISTC